ncbi:MAG: metal-dependent hydrolase [Thermoanaerobaculia bacterium]
MDTISHSFAGAILSRSLEDRPTQWTALAVGAVAAVVPDLDFLLISNRIEYLRDHRSWTHSFLVLPFLALAIALVAKMFARRTSLAKLWLFAAVGIASHIVFDWATSFGTMFWTPVSRARHSLDWLFIIDPIFTGITLGTLVLCLIFRTRARRIARVGSGVLASYLAICAVLHARALAIWRGLDSPPANARVSALPQFLSPFRWMGLSETDDEIHLAFFDIGPFARGVENPQAPTRWRDVLQSLSDFYPPPGRARIQRYEKPPASRLLEAARRLPDWQVYMDFARFPLETVYPEGGGGATIILQDLRFLPFFSGPWEPDQVQGIRRQPFVFRVRLDPALNAVELGFVRGGR